MARREVVRSLFFTRLRREPRVIPTLSLPQHRGRKQKGGPNEYGGAVRTGVQRKREPETPRAALDGSELP